MIIYGDERTYGMAAGFGVSESCESEVVQQLSDPRLRSFEYMNRDGSVAEDEFFSAEQNAGFVQNCRRISSVDVRRPNFQLGSPRPSHG